MEQQDRRGPQVEEEQQKGHCNFDAGVARTSAFRPVTRTLCVSGIIQSIATGPEARRETPRLLGTAFPYNYRHRLVHCIVGV